MKILILGAGYYYIKLLQEIKALGYEVHVLDKNPVAPGMAFGDYSAAIDICDKEQVLKYAKNHKIDGIMPINDFGVPTACYVSQRMGLIGNTLVSGIASCDKGIMRDIWHHENLPQPNYHVFSPKYIPNNLEEIIGYPMVVKPTDSGAGRGVSVVSNPSELSFAIKHSQVFAKNNRIIAESFMDGVEITVDGIVYKNSFYLLAVSDKIKPESRFRVATSLNFPADFSADIVNKVTIIVAKAAESLGIVNGACHAELIISHDQKSINLVEMGARGGGGHLFSMIIQHICGVNAPQELAKILCGQVPNLKITRSRGCVYRFFNPNQTGIITDISYDTSITSIPSVLDFGITARVGDKFLGLIDSIKRIGYVIVDGKDRVNAIKNADEVESMVKITICSENE